MNLVQPGFVFFILSIAVWLILPVAMFIMVLMTYRRVASIDRKLDRFLGGGQRGDGR